jgi:hypothetical protein
MTVKIWKLVFRAALGYHANKALKTVHVRTSEIHCIPAEMYALTCIDIPEGNRDVALAYQIESV